MNHQELFILHPVAYTHAQDVLAVESDMISNGLAVEQRVEFLKTELGRITAMSDVLVAEAWEELFNELTRDDLLIDLDVMKKRFERHGFSGTLRDNRNLQRRQGINLPALDPTLLIGALGVLDEDSEVGDLMHNLLGNRVQSLLSHPASVAAEETYNGIMASPQLLSVRDAQARELAASVFGKVISETSSDWDFTGEDIRTIVKLYSKILDVSIVDILVSLVSKGAISEVRASLKAGIESSGILYRHVLSEVILHRIQQMQSPESPSVPGAILTEAPSFDDKEVQSAPQKESKDHTLLTVPDAIRMLNVSRSTLNRLMSDGRLIPVRIGRAIRFNLADIQRFIGIDKLDNKSR